MQCLYVAETTVLLYCPLRRDVSLQELSICGSCMFYRIVCVIA